MNYKGYMRHDINVNVPAWVIMELWELLHDINRTPLYDEEDIAALRYIIDNKVNSIQKSAEYQVAHFGKSKYDL